MQVDWSSSSVMGGVDYSGVRGMLFGVSLS